MCQQLCSTLCVLQWQADCFSRLPTSLAWFLVLNEAFQVEVFRFFLFLFYFFFNVKVTECKKNNQASRVTILLKCGREVSMDKHLYSSIQKLQKKCMLLKLLFAILFVLNKFFFSLLLLLQHSLQQGIV